DSCCSRRWLARRRHPERHGRPDHRKPHRPNPFPPRRCGERAVNVSILLATAAARGIGAALRYAIDRFLLADPHKGVHVGIVVVNITGALALGGLSGLGALLSSELAAVVGVGLRGGYTTFSAVHVETVLLGKRRQWRQALVNLFGTVILT